MQQVLINTPSFNKSIPGGPRKIPVFTIPWLEDPSFANYLILNNTNAFFIISENGGELSFKFRSQEGKLDVKDLFGIQPLLVVVREELMCLDSTSIQTKQELLNEQRYQWC